MEPAVREITGFRYVVPTHQGRAAENILMQLHLKPGDIVLNNTHFDTTKAHVEQRGAVAVDLMSDALWRFDERHPFKGNFDLAKLRAALERHHRRVPLIVVTVLNNFACSSPVSMENIREVRQLADAYGIPLFIDACRMSENAYFIKTREKGYQDHSIVEIVREMLSHADACWMSAKKDGLVNIGGFIATNDQSLLRRCQELVVLYEGFHSYGGLARRDLEAMAQGLREGTAEDYLAHRIRLVAYLGERLEDQGIVISQPVGGSGVFIDVEKLYPHLGPDQCPGIALFCDLYREGGIRGGGFPFTVNTVTPDTGEIIQRVFQFVRFAVARRVYSKAHMDYVAAIMGRVKQLAPENRGLPSRGKARAPESLLREVRTRRLTRRLTKGAHVDPRARVFEEGIGPRPSRARNSSTISGAGRGARTHKPLSRQRILKSAAFTISPPRPFQKIGPILQLTPDDPARRCSCTEMPPVTRPAAARGKTCLPEISGTLEDPLL